MGCLSCLTFTNYATIDKLVHMFFYAYVEDCVGYILRRGISRSKEKCLYFGKYARVTSISSCMILHQQNVGLPSSPQPSKQSVIPNIYIANIIGKKWHSDIVYFFLL